MAESGRAEEIALYTGELYPANVATRGERIAYVGVREETVGPRTRIVDATGRAFLRPFLTPFMGGSEAAKFGPALASMLIYILMAAVLFVRPQGLFPPRGL